MHIARVGLCVALLAPLAYLVPACSGDDSTTTPSDGGAGEATTGQDSGGSDSGGGSDAESDAAPVICNNLTPGTPIPVAARQDTPPVGAGGGIPDGTYVAAAAGLYLGSFDAGSLNLGTTDTKMQIQGSTVNVVQTSNGKVTTETDTFSLSGSSITLTPTCPSGLTGTTAQYSARAADADAGVPNGGFDLIVTEKGLTEVVTLAKQ